MDHGSLMTVQVVVNLPFYMFSFSSHCGNHAKIAIIINLDKRKARINIIIIIPPIFSIKDEMIFFLLLLFLFLFSTPFMRSREIKILWEKWGTGNKNTSCVVRWKLFSENRKNCSMIQSNSSPFHQAHFYWADRSSKSRIWSRNKVGPIYRRK